MLRKIHGADELRISLEDAAAIAFLSPDRFAHLFKEQMGLPFRKYVLWRKLTRATVAIGAERTIADAAHAADFSDAAHLTRTFYQMIGMAPSALMRGYFAGIPSPFSAADDELLVRSRTTAGSSNPATQADCDTLSVDIGSTHK